MGLGEVTFRNPKNYVSPKGNPVAGGSRRHAPGLPALILMVAAAILLWGAVAGLAKNKIPPSKTLSGVVFDDAENPINGAMIELKDIQTEKTLDIYSQEQGQYQFTDLRLDHDYTVQATYKGSSSETRHVSMFDTRTRPVLNLTIPKPNK